MAAVHPFRALRPVPALASQIAAVPYDVVNTDEARALAAGNPLSFLRVSRAEIDLPPDTDPYADVVYERARRNFEDLRRSSLHLEDEPLLYCYRLALGGAAQTGLAACFSVDEYERDVIRKHERTRRDKEDDRTRHIITLGAQTGPVFLVYRSSTEVGTVTARVTAGHSLFDFEAVDGVRHTIWPVGGNDSRLLVEAFSRIPVLYIADGHHRAASAARARAYLRDRGLPGTDLGDGAGAGTMLAVAFPHDEVQVMAYNRVVKDLNGRSASQFLAAVGERFLIEPGGPVPARRGEVAMFLDGAWTSLRPRVAPDEADAVASLDVSVLQDRLLAPVLGIADVRTDKRIDFVGGARGAEELERLVGSGKAAVAFSLFPVSVADLMRVSDAGAIMPPKSTWFEPKLRDGLLSHLI
jgi:uncharacterized protein (DUF1015 family)